MPMATVIAFSPNAEVSQGSPREVENMSYIDLQVLSPSTIQSGATEYRISSDPLHLCILEQPKNKWRYRYQSEKGSHGPLPGCTSSPSKKAFPAVKVVNIPENLDIYVRASLWTTDEVPRLHVHKLFGPSCSSDGVCTVKVNKDGIAVFQDITILFVAKKDVPKILYGRMQKEEENCNTEQKQLEKLAAAQAKAMNLNSVRICFEAIWFNNGNPEDVVSLCSPVFSEPVANLRSPKDGDLKICRMSAYKGFASGGDEVFLLCCKVDKKDIQVRFYEPSSHWEGFGKFTEADVHQQCAIVFRTPPYQHCDIKDSVKVFLQLQRKNGDCSESVEFVYIPDDPDDEMIAKKRKKHCTYHEFDESGSDSSTNFGTQNINRNFEAQTFNATVVNQNSPLGAESVNDSSLDLSAGSASSDILLGADFSQTYVKSFDDMLESDPFSTEDSINRLLTNHADPLLSQANVPKPRWWLPAQDDPMKNSFLDTDAVVANIELPEDVKNKPLNQRSLSVEAERVEAALSKLSISGKSAIVLENNGSCHTGANQMKVTEEVPKHEQNANTMLPKMEHFQQRTVSDSSLKSIWSSLCVALKKRNPFDFLRNIPGVIRFYDEDQNTLLHVAVSLQPPCEFTVECLLKTAEEMHFPLVNLANKDRQTPLHIAVKTKKPSVVRLLLKYGADATLVDKRGFSVYHWAVYVKSKDCLNELLQKQMNYKLPPKTSHLDSTGYDGLAPLHYAVREELIECITLLCFHGADVNVRSKKDGRTPLHYAALQNKKVPSILLSKKTADVNAQDYGGNTPLHLACSSGNAEVVQVLMSYGADPTIRNYGMDGITPFGFAEGNEEVKSILMRSCGFKEKQNLHFRRSTGIASLRSEAPLPNSTCKSKESGPSLELQYKSESKFCPKSGCTSTAQGDSGYISGDLPLFNEDLLQKLSRLLDPPNDLWKNLMMITIEDDDFEKNVLKLTSSPTRAILKAFMNNGGTAEMLVNALEAAALPEAQDIVIQHICQKQS